MISAFPGRHLNLRNSLGLDFRPNSTRRAQPSQVSGEPVGKVHHGSRDTLFSHPTPKSQSRLRVEMLLDARTISMAGDSALPQPLQAELRLPQAPRYKNQVAGFRPGTQDSAATTNFANHSHVNPNIVAFRRVSTR